MRNRHAQLSQQSCGCGERLTLREVHAGMRRCQRCVRASPGRPQAEKPHRVIAEPPAAPMGSWWATEAAQRDREVFAEQQAARFALPVPGRAVFGYPLGDLQ